MLSRERGARRTDANEAAVNQSGASSHLRHECSFAQRFSGSNLPLDESKPGLRCTPRIQAGVSREELVICVTSEGHGMDGRKLKRRLGGDIVARDASAGKSGVREGLRLVHSPPEGLRRRKKGSESRIASADVPLALGSDEGNKRRSRAPPVYKGSGGDHEKECKASQSSTGHAEENERRSERVKERLKLEEKKMLEESQAIHWEVQFGSGRHKKSSKRKQKGNRGKSKLQAKEQVKESWTSNREKGMSSVSAQGHDERGDGLAWTRRLRERGKKRVLEFCAEVEVEAFASDVRVVKQKVEKVDETLQSITEQISDELDELFVKSWSRKHPRKFRTRARFQTLTKQESQAGTTQYPGGTELDHLPSSSGERQLGVSSADATVNRSIEETGEPITDKLLNGWHVPSKEHVSSSVEESASKSFHEKFRGRHAQDSSATEGSTEYRVEGDVPIVPLENNLSEVLHVESEEQIHLVLHLCIESSKDQNEKDDVEPLASTAVSSPIDTVSHLPMEPLSGLLRSPSCVSPPLQALSFADCEIAEATSASAAGGDTVDCDPSTTTTEMVPESREYQNWDEIALAKVVEVEKLRICWHDVREKVVHLGEHLGCNQTTEEVVLEDGQHGACNKIPDNGMVQAGGREICTKINDDEVFETCQIAAGKGGAKEKVVEGPGDRGCTKMSTQTAVEIMEHTVRSEVIKDTVLEGREDMVCSEVVKEKEVEVKEHEVCTEIISERAVEDSEHRVYNAVEREKLSEIQDHILCREVGKEKMVEVRENVFCRKVAREKEFEGQKQSVHTEVARDKVLKEQELCNDVSNVKAREEHRVCNKVAEEQVLEFRHITCSDISQEVLEAEEHSEDLSLESGDECASGNSDEDTSGSTGKEVPQRGPEESAGNSVDDDDVLAKYCRTKSRRSGSRTIVETTNIVKVISERGTFEDEKIERTEISGEDPVPSSLKASTSTGRSGPAEEDGSEDQEETAGTRLQSLLDVVRNEVNATPELGESWDCTETKVLHVVSHSVERKDESHSEEIFAKERAAKCSNDFRRGIVSSGLKCGLCGGTSDGKWTCELRSARKTKQYGSPKVTKFAVKEGSKLQVKKGWLGRLLGPLSERVGVAGAWVHEECAVWSPEVYFAGVGRLKNVKAAIRRGRLLKCSHCGQPGATIGCRVDRCPQNYHLPCAHFDGCSFDHKKYLVACSEHLHLFPSRYRRFLDYGVEVQMAGSGDVKDTSKLHRGNFRRMMIERRAAASSARLKDLEEEEKYMEKSGEDEEFVRRERKRLQRDLARIVPTKLGGRKNDGEEITISEGWNSVAGLQDVVECLKEMVILPLLYPGAFEKLGVVPPRGVLLHGHSGTGKTLVVRALAGACARGTQKISYFARKGADCLGKYVGDAERQLRLLFQVAEQHQPSIIFFDEIDGLAPSRSRDGQDQTHSSVVSTLLALMDGLSSRGSVIVIGATNRPDALDPALRRPGRFDREIYFPLPSAADRAAILALHTGSWVPCPSGEVLSAVAKATHGFAGADLRALCVEAALKALKRVAPIHQLMESAERRQVGIGLPRLPEIEVKASDWARALKEAPPPCSMRMTSAALSFIPGSPLPWYLVPSLLPAVVEVLMQLHGDGRSSMPPEISKAVSLIALELESFARGSKLCEVKSQFKWMALLQAAGHKLMKSVEAALFPAGLVGNRERLSDSGHVEPLCGEAFPGNPFDMDSSASDSKLHTHGGWRGGHFRVLISGKEKRGQRLVAASIITGFEGFCETRMLNLPTMLHEGDGDVIQGLNCILGAGKGTTPCMLFMPQIESWSMVKEEVSDESPLESKTSSVSDVHDLDDEELSEETVRSDVPEGSGVATVSSTWSVFLQHIKCLSPDTSMMFLATSHLPVEELPSKVVDFFSSDTTKPKEKHAISRNQPVPCAVVQLPPFREHMTVVERASQDISRSLAGRLVRYLSHIEKSSNGTQTSALSRLEDSGLPADEMHKEGMREEGVDDGDKCLVGHAERSKLVEQMPSSRVDFNMPERSGPKPCLPGFTQKPESCGRNSLYDCTVSLSRPRSFPGSWSSEQKTLQIAISRLSHQILNQSHLSDLRRISRKMKAGPCISSSLIDQRILGTANHYRDGFFPGGNKCFEDRFDRRDEKNTHASHVYGLEAIGMKGKSGHYVSGTEFACEIATVLKLIRERVKTKVESGRDHSMYVPLLSKVSGLEDLVSSWLYQIRRLEAAAKVFPSNGLQSGATDLNGTEYVSHSEAFEAHEAPAMCQPQCCDPAISSCKILEKVGETCPKESQYAVSVDHNAICSHSDRATTEDATTTHSLKMDVEAACLDTAEGCDTTQVMSEKLTAEGTITTECSQPINLVDHCNSDAEVNLQASPASHVKSHDTSKFEGRVAGSTDEKACRLPAEVSRKNRPKKRRVRVRTESLLPLELSVRNMILLAWKEHSAESVELLYDVIASCAASIRVVSDELIREVDWTSGCPGDSPCSVCGQQTSEVVDLLNQDLCLCPLTKAVRKLTSRSSEDAVDLSQT